MNILVIEDDPVIGRALERGFTEVGHAVTWCQDSATGLQAALSEQADAIVLDHFLPGETGLELTALGAVDDRVRGLNAGADDYMVKPFEFEELRARVEAIYRRANSKPSINMEVGEMKLDLATRRVMVGDQEVELTPIEFSLLELLMRFAGQVVTRKMLCEHVWGFTWDGNTNVIEVHINRLRGKLDQGRDESCIRTIRGRGYAVRT
jgi:DNA-binding response OmpR family regulator